MSNNNNLEKLVSSFVNEDKARQQQAAAASARKTTTTSILTSGTIRDALRKFETNGGTTSIGKPNFALRNSAASQRMSGSTATIHSPPPNTNQSVMPVAAGTKLCKNVPDVLMNTIEQSAAAQSQSASATSISKESSPPPLLRPKPETPAKPASLINHQPTWPLKNRIAQSAASKKSSGSSGNAAASRHQSNGDSGATETDGSQTRRATSGTAVNKVRHHPVNLMDEVLLEEERLINALKTGTVLSCEKVQLPEVITSTMQPDSEHKWSAPDISTTNGLSGKTTSITSSSPSSTTVPQPATAATAASPGLCSIASTITAIAATASVAGMPHIDTADATSNTNGNSNDSSSNGVRERLADLQQKAVNTANTQDAPNASNNGALKVTKNPRPRNDAAVPHPEISLSTIKLNHITNSSRNPGSTSTVRPFLTRGSVAERVLMFEKCPELKPMRIAPKEPSKLSVSSKLCIINTITLSIFFT